MTRNKNVTMSYNESHEDSDNNPPAKSGGGSFWFVIIMAFLIIGFVGYDKYKNIDNVIENPENVEQPSTTKNTKINEKELNYSNNREISRESRKETNTYTVYQKWANNELGIYELEDINGNIRRVDKKFFMKAKIGCIYRER